MIFILRHWRFMPPHPCDGRAEIPLAKVQYGESSLILFIVWLLAILFAVLPRTRVIWRRLSILCQCLSLVGNIVQQEVGMGIFPGYDTQFVSQTFKWGLGQIMTMTLAVQQILEGARYYQSTRVENRRAFASWKHVSRDYHSGSEGEVSGSKMATRQGKSTEAQVEAKQSFP